jgi:hypothetical protein
MLECGGRRGHGRQGQLRRLATTGRVGQRSGSWPNDLRKTCSEANVWWLAERRVAGAHGRYESAYGGRISSLRRLDESSLHAGRRTAESANAETGRLRYCLISGSVSTGRAGPANRQLGGQAATGAYPGEMVEPKALWALARWTVRAAARIAFLGAASFSRRSPPTLRPALRCCSVLF